MPRREEAARAADVSPDSAEGLDELFDRVVSVLEDEDDDAPRASREPRRRRVAVPRDLDAWLAVAYRLGPFVLLAAVVVLLLVRGR